MNFQGRNSAVLLLIVLLITSLSFINLFHVKLEHSIELPSAMLKTAYHSRRNETATKSTSRSCLVFFHIPKTGGTSMDNYLKRFKSQNYDFVTFYESNIRLDFKLRQHKKHVREAQGSSTSSSTTITPSRPGIIYTGHFTPQFLDLSDTHHCYKMTVMREAVDRVVSAFYYYNFSSDWSSCLHKNREDLCPHFWNYQNDVVRLLSNQTKTWNSYDTREYKILQPNVTSLKAAKRFLESLDLVCFMDQLEHCRERVLQLLHIEPHQGMLQHPQNTSISKGIDHQNKNSRRRPVNTSLWRKLQDLNSLDVELYNWARRRYSFLER